MSRGVGVARQSYTDSCTISSTPSRSGDSIPISLSCETLNLRNSFNITYFKGNIQSNGSILWDETLTLTKDSVSDNNNYYPSIVMDWKDHPLIVFTKSICSNAYSLRRYGLQSNGTTWIENIIFNGLRNIILVLRAIVTVEFPYCIMNQNLLIMM